MPSTPGFVIGGGSSTPTAAGESISVGGYSVTDGLAGTAVVGGSPRALVAADYALADLTPAWSLVVCGSVTPATTGTVVLWSLFEGAAVATITITDTAPATAHSVSIDPSAMPTTYELRASCTGGTSGNYVIINAAAIRVTWS